MYKKPPYHLQLEQDISLYIDDERKIAEQISNEEFKNFVYKHQSPAQFVRILERLTEEFWKAGFIAGMNEAIAEVRKLMDMTGKSV